MAKRLEDFPASVQESIRRAEAMTQGVAVGTLPPPPYSPVKIKPNKYRNVRVSEMIGGISYHFDSKLERACFERLQEVFGQANVFHHARSFHLPGGVRMIPDFMVRVPQHGDRHDPKGMGFYRYHYADAKGMPATADWKNKRKQVLAIYGDCVTVIKTVGEIHRNMFDAQLGGAE